MRCWRGGWWRWRVSLAYDGERADAQVLDQLETILRHVADELAGWRARAVKAEGELKESGARGGGAAAQAHAGNREPGAGPGEGEKKPGPGGGMGRGRGAQ